MAKITISGDSFEEIQAVLDSVYAAAENPAMQQQPAQQPAQAAQAAQAAPAAESGKGKGRGKGKAEAPPPVQPNQTQGNGADAASPFQNAQSPFAPVNEAPAFNGAAPQERPQVTKFKTLLEQLAATHGDQQVYTWAMQKAFGMPASITKEEFLSTHIHDIPDAALEAAYRQGGGR